MHVNHTHISINSYDCYDHPAKGRAGDSSLCVQGVPVPSLRGRKVGRHLHAHEGVLIVAARVVDNGAAPDVIEDRTLVLRVPDSRTSDELRPIRTDCVHGPAVKLVAVRIPTGGPSAATL